MISFDYRKCFDLVSQEIVFAIAKRLGLDSRVLKGVKAAYSGAHMRFKVSENALGSEWQPTNGIKQGCPLSIILLNCLTHVWVSALAAETSAAADVECGVYADDASATSKNADGLREVASLTEEFANFTGQELSIDKCACTCNDETERNALQGQVQIGGKALKVVSQMELLGIVFDFFDPQSDDKNTKFQKAIQKLQIRADRGAKLPLPKTERAKVIATAAITALTYGQSVLSRYGDAIKKARNRITRSLGFTHTPPGAKK